MTSTSAEEESMRDYRTHRPGTYQEMTAGFRWEVPASYNLAADVLDKHEPERPAMRFVSDEGRDERWTFGDMRRLTDRTANTLRGLGVGKGDRVAVMAPASPEIAAAFLATYKVEAILLSMSVLYGDDAIAYRLNDAEAKVLICSAAHRDRVAALLDKAPSVEHLVVVGGQGRESFEELTGAAADRFETPATDPDTPAQLYYTSGTTGLAKGILHAHRYLLGHEEFTYCHDVRDGERFRGMGEWAWAAGIAPLLGPWRLGAVQVVVQRAGGFDPVRELDALSRHGVTHVFTTPTAVRSMMSISDAGTRYPIDFAVVCSAGEPLTPEAIRWFREQYGVTVLDYYGMTESYPMVANYPFMEVRE